MPPTSLVQGYLELQAHRKEVSCSLPPSCHLSSWTVPTTTLSTGIVMEVVLEHVSFSSLCLTLVLVAEETALSQGD